MSMNPRAAAVLLTALFLAPIVMAQGETAPGGAQPQTPPATTTPTKPAKTKKKGEKKVKKGEKKVKKGEKEKEKGKMEEKKGAEEQKGATTPAPSQPTNP